jgi:hypothetical protein
MEFRMTFGDLNGSSEDRRSAINEAIQMADANPRADKLVLPQGEIDVADGLQYHVTGDTSAALQIDGQGGRSWGTILNCVGSGPTMTIGTTGGGNFRRCPLSGVTIRRRGLKFENVGYNYSEDLCFHGINMGPCIEAENSNLLLGTGIVQHCGLFYKGSGGSVQVGPNYQMGEHVGGFDLLGTFAEISCMVSISLRSSPETQVDINEVPFGAPLVEGGVNTVRPYIKAMDGSKVLVKGSQNIAGPATGIPESEVCTTYIITDKVRDVSIAAGAQLHVAKATSLVTTRIQNAGTEPGAAFVLGDDVIVTSDLGPGEKFTVFDSLFNGAGTGFDKPRFNGAVEVRDDTETGFQWSDGVAEGQGLVTHFGQKRLNTD